MAGLADARLPADAIIAKKLLELVGLDAEGIGLEPADMLAPVGDDSVCGAASEVVFDVDQALTIGGQPDEC